MSKQSWLNWFSTVSIQFICLNFRNSHLKISQELPTSSGRPKVMWRWSLRGWRCLFLQGGMSSRATLCVGPLLKFWRPHLWELNNIFIITFPSSPWALNSLLFPIIFYLLRPAFPEFPTTQDLKKNTETLHVHGLMYWQTHEMLRGKRLLQAPILRCMQQCLGCCLSQSIQVLELKGGTTRNWLGGGIPVFETQKFKQFSRWRLMTMILSYCL